MKLSASSRHAPQSFTNKEDRAYQGVFWAISWAFVFSGTMSIAKLLSKDVHIVVLVFMRLTFGLVFFAPFLFHEKIQNIKTKRLPLHLLRFVFTSGALVCTYYAYRNLPLAFATSIGFSGPFITIVFAILILGDKVSWEKWAAVLMGYVGVIVMVRPGFVVFDAAIGIALMANIFASCALIAVKKLSSTENTLQIMFYPNIASFLLFGILALYYWETPSPRDLKLLILLGGAGTFSQFCYVQALKKSKASFVAPFEYTRLVFAIPVGFLLFSELPDFWTLIGSFIIVASNLALIALDRKTASTKRTNPPKGV